MMKKSDDAAGVGEEKTAESINQRDWYATHRCKDTGKLKKLCGCEHCAASQPPETAPLRASELLDEADVAWAEQRQAEKNAELAALRDAAHVQRNDPALAAAEAVLSSRGSHPVVKRPPSQRPGWLRSSSPFPRNVGARMLSVARRGGEGAEQPPSPAARPSSRLRGTPLAWLHERRQPMPAAPGCCGDGASAAGSEALPQRTCPPPPSALNKGTRKPAKKERNRKRAPMGAADKRREADSSSIEPVPSPETAAAATEPDERRLELERALEFMSAQLCEARVASAAQQAAFEAEREKSRQEAAANARWISQLCAEIQRLRAAVPCHSGGGVAASNCVGGAETNGTLRRSCTNHIV